MSPLPIRLAQCRHARLEAFDDDYFSFLRKMGSGALYLQNAPFDPMRTGNTGQFFHHFHLISLFDISRSHRREEYQDYINEICRRAANHGIEVWLDCWEPRLPDYAQALLPPEWRGRGGWGWHGSKEIAFCWEVPEAVAFWKSMARDAIAGLPGISGVIVSMIDNEASFCDASCPRCGGRSLRKGIADVFSTFSGIAEQRTGGFKLAMYDWWLPAELVDEVTGKLPAGSLVIGRSARGISFSAREGLWSGKIADISNIADGLAEDFPGHCQKANARGLVPIDMVSWSRGMENFFLPAPPDPLFAIRKCRALKDAGAGGWMDYDCGCIEPGSLATAMSEWTADPDAEESELLDRTLREIWADAAGDVLPAYDLYREAKTWMPTGIPSREVANMDARGCGLGYCLFSPFHLDDLRFHDTTHAWNYFAPYNLFAGDTIPHLLRSATEVTSRLEEAAQIARDIPAADASASWEKAVFEIHWRSFRALRNYARLADAKWRRAQGGLDDDGFLAFVNAIAIDELDNLDAIERWHAAHPGHLGNPCHRILGHLVEAWPDADFDAGIFLPKRKSLLFLRDEFDPKELRPSHSIQGKSSDWNPL
jgi:hypothetical protein